MSKPSWKHAPHWANWLAQDPVGGLGGSYWVWFAEKPVHRDLCWMSDAGPWKQTEDAAELSDWKETLEPRP